MERFLCAIALTVAVAFASGYVVQQFPSLYPPRFPFARLLMIFEVELGSS